MRIAEVRRFVRHARSRCGGFGSWVFCLRAMGFSGVNTRTRRHFGLVSAPLAVVRLTNPTHQEVAPDQADGQQNSAAKREHQGQAVVGVPGGTFARGAVKRPRDDLPPSDERHSEKERADAQVMQDFEFLAGPEDPKPKTIARWPQPY